MNKPLVAVLVSLIALGTINFVMAAAPGTIQNVFVTNWPRNQNVTVTNPPTVVVNVNASPRTPPPISITLAENRTIQGQTTPIYWLYVWQCTPYDTFLVKTDGYSRMDLLVRKLDPYDAPTTNGAYDIPNPWVEWKVGNVTAKAAEAFSFDVTPFQVGQPAPFGLTMSLVVRGPYALVHVSNCYNQPQQYSLAVYLSA